MDGMTGSRFNILCMRCVGVYGVEIPRGLYVCNGQEAIECQLQYSYVHVQKVDEQTAMFMYRKLMN